MTINFNGHIVEDVREGVYGVINHYVNPVIGMIRLDDADGRPYDRERLHEAYRKASTDILKSLKEHFFVPPISKPTVRKLADPPDPQNPWRMTWDDPETGPGTFFDMPKHERAVQFVTRQEWLWSYFRIGWTDVWSQVVSREFQRNNRSIDFTLPPPRATEETE